MKYELDYITVVNHFLNKDFNMMSKIYIYIYHLNL